MYIFLFIIALLLNAIAFYCYLSKKFNVFFPLDKEVLFIIQGFYLIYCLNTLGRIPFNELAAIINFGIALLIFLITWIKDDKTAKSDKWK
ncbi:MAG: hypothetical protein HWE27_10540 [Gammaproteobacteria bacterium]|nr:hypothetical protein [Gammaproteobacteria bacterium]